MQLSRPLGEAALAPDDPIDNLLLEEFLEVNRGLAVDVLIVIPAYNEADSLPGVLDRMPETIASHRVAILVVSDGSTDGTAKAAADRGVLTIAAPINRGQGAALKLGYLVAIRLKARYVAVVDADGQWDPADLSFAIDILDSGSATFVQGSRVLGSSEVGDSFRDLGVTFFGWLISLLIGTKITDTSSGIRAFTTGAIDGIRLDQPQYQSSELLIAAAMSGAAVCEFPVTMSKRTAGSSKKAKNALYGWYYLRAVIRTFLREFRTPRP